MWRLTTKVERTNIPIAVSLLYERDLMIYRTKKIEKGRRRAFTEGTNTRSRENTNKYHGSIDFTSQFSIYRMNKSANRQYS